jgi:hypothetical protein
MEPLILSFTYDELHSYGAHDSSVMFDFNGDGRKNITGWICSDNGFLVFFTAILTALSMMVRTF